MALKIAISIKVHERVNLTKDNNKKERINQKTKSGYPTNTPMSSLPIMAKIQPKINPVITLEIKVISFICTYYCWASCKIFDLIACLSLAFGDI